MMTSFNYVELKVFQISVENDENKLIHSIHIVYIYNIQSRTMNQCQNEFMTKLFSKCNKNDT